MRALPHRVSSVIAGLAFLLAVLALGPSCRSSGGPGAPAPGPVEPAASPTLPSPAAAPASAPAPAPAATPAPAAAAPQAAAQAAPAPPTQASPPALPPRDPAAPRGPLPIAPSTRRMAAGLPEHVQSYASWTPLRAAASPPEGTAQAHRPLRAAYGAAPDGGKLLPLKPGTALVLEEKLDAEGFISRLSTMTRTESGWTYAAFSRRSSSEPFAADASSAECAGCHAKAEPSSAFSGLE
ncbi:MAG: hypothetical protein HY721_15535 [Planctomycetes bacterium]|nr:hypothetical protein [Planctomycetota bacterium]